MAASIFTDQLNRKINISSQPKKIISLVPSLTELICDLGLEEKLIGVTKFCVHPAHIRKSKKIIGGTKNLRLDEIRKLQPDLIIANKEENDQKQIEELTEFFPVWVSDVKTFDDALDLIRKLGEVTGSKNQSEKIVEQIQVSKTNFQSDLLNSKRRTRTPKIQTIYLIWKNPYMTIGGDTFISSMLEMAGFNNIFGSELRYPVIGESELRALNPELILLSSEPYPFKEKHLAELQTISPGSKVLLADGEMFSWYGSRLIHSFRYFSRLITTYYH